MRKTLLFGHLAILLILFGRMPSYGVGPMFWEQSSFRDFQQGKVMGCSVSQDGRITLAPAMKSVFSTDQVLIWSMAQDSHGNLFLGTGHGGKVFKIDSQNQGKVFFTAKELDVFALAVDAKGDLFVASSPDGKVYRVAPDGSSAEFFNPRTKYIWALSFDRNGNLFVGTGDQGKIFKVGPDGKGSLFYETKQTHVMSLEKGPQDSLLAGTFPEGILYRISPSGKGFVLYDSPQQEVHSIAVGSDGSIYIGCLSEKVPQRFAPTALPATVSPTEASATGGVTVTVTESPGQATAEPHAPPQLTQTPFAGAFFGGIRSAIYRIAPDLSVETMWSSREESVYDLLAAGTDILFGTDSRGRLYKVQPDRKITLLAQTNEGQMSRLILRNQIVYAATSNVGKLFEMGTSSPLSGSVESSIKDTQLISRWGVISWEGETVPGTSIQFYTRTGNSDKPDSTWSDWSAAYTHSDGEQITSPPARFIQWKTELKGADKSSPWIDAVTIAYLPQNVRPQINSLTVVSQSLTSPTQSAYGTFSRSDGEMKSGSASGDSSPSVTVTAFPTTSMASREKVTITWQSEDKNHDTLEYSIFIRGTQETQWRLLEKNVRETTFSLDPETLPDGKYRVRVVASDDLSNPAKAALTAEADSEVFQIDNTPPKVEVTSNQVDGNSVTIRFRASDGASELRRAEYSVDSGKWQMTESDDGIVDSRLEEFTVLAADLSPGEHVITFRVFDSCGNPGLAKAVVNIQAK